LGRSLYDRFWRFHSLAVDAWWALINFGPLMHVDPRHVMRAIQLVTIPIEIIGLLVGL
jgi:hypothetical protein